MVTFGLLYLMQLMIATGRAPMDGHTPHRLVPYVRVLPGPPEPKPPARRERPTVEPPPPRAVIDQPGTEGPVITVTPPAPPSRQRRDPGSFGLVDGEALPVVKVLPQYPTAALRQNLEGYVIVEFTITRTGTVADVVVVESSHRIFERSAVDAAYKFKYRPRVINGEPVEVRGKQHRISFEIGR